jgi:hypothetical protein
MQTAAVCNSLRELKPAFMIPLLYFYAARQGLQACYRSGAFFVKLNALRLRRKGEALTATIGSKAIEKPPEMAMRGTNFLRASRPDEP